MVSLNSKTRRWFSPRRSPSWSVTVALILDHLGHSFIFSNSSIPGTLNNSVRPCNVNLRHTRSGCLTGFSNAPLEELDHKRLLAVLEAASTNPAADLAAKEQ